MTQQGGTGGRQKLLFSSSLMILVVLWLGMTTSLQWQELLVGFLSVTLTLLFLWSVYRGQPRQFDLRSADLLSLWRTPWYLVSSLWEIIAVLLLDLIKVQPAPSFYRVCGFQSSKDEPHMVARRALATAYTSIAPNFIVIGIDYSQSRMLFHQIRRSKVPLMTKQLGALVTSDPNRHSIQRQGGVRP